MASFMQMIMKYKIEYYYIQSTLQLSFRCIIIQAKSCIAKPFSNRRRVSGQVGLVQPVKILQAT